MTSPLRRVLDEISSGTLAVAEVAARTGLRRDVVSAAAQQLARLGLVDAASLAPDAARTSGRSCGGATGCARCPSRTCNTSPPS